VRQRFWPAQTLAPESGEAIASGSVNHAFSDGDGKLHIENLTKEEGATTFYGRPDSKKIPGYRYPTENSLRGEQGKKPYQNYNVLSLTN
jgi:hypothetical protein